MIVQQELESCLSVGIGDRGDIGLVELKHDLVIPILVPLWQRRAIRIQVRRKVEPILDHCLAEDNVVSTIGISRSKDVRHIGRVVGPKIVWLPRSRRGEKVRPVVGKSVLVSPLEEIPSTRLTEDVTVDCGELFELRWPAKELVTGIEWSAVREDIRVHLVETLKCGIVQWLE